MLNVQMEISSPPEVGTSQETSGEEVVRSKTGIWGFMQVTGVKILGVMDYVGETVVGVLGLDDSKFQYVMDGMDREDWEKAVLIDRERRLEDAIFDAAEELQKSTVQMREEGGDVEGGAADDMTIKEFMNIVREQVTAEFWEKEIQESPEVEREIRQVVPDKVRPMEREGEEESTAHLEEVEVAVSVSEEKYAASIMTVERVFTETVTIETVTVETVDTEAV